MVHVLDVAHDFKVDPPERLFDRNFLGPQRQQIAAMLAPRLNLRTDRRLQLEWTDVVAVPEDQTLPAHLATGASDKVEAEWPRFGGWR